MVAGDPPECVGDTVFVNGRRHVTEIRWSRTGSKETGKNDQGVSREARDGTGRDKAYSTRRHERTGERRTINEKDRDGEETQGALR